MPRILCTLAILLCLNTISFSARADNGQVAAFVIGLILGMADSDSAEQQQKRQRELEVQNQLLRQYMAERIAREQRERQIAQQQMVAEIERRKTPPVAIAPSFSTGSGFFLNKPGFVLTNSHVVQGGQFFYVRTRDGNLLQATLVNQDTTADLALLKVASAKPGLVVTHFSNVTKGQKIYAIGYPVPRIQGGESKITEGIISSFTGLRNTDLLFQISAAIQPGNSGGPLLNEKGEVLGVVVAKAAEDTFLKESGQLPQNVNFAVRTDALNSFLKKNNVDQDRGKLQKQHVNPLDYADAGTVMVVASGTAMNLPQNATVAAKVEDAETLAWSEAKTEGSCLALDRYLRWYKDSNNSKTALKLRKEADDLAWAKAVQANSIVAYREYEISCPGHLRKASVDKAIVQLEALETKLSQQLDQLRAATKSNRCGEIEEFIKTYPDSKYVNEAKNYLAQIESKKYNFAIKSNSEVVWNDFLSACPRSQFSAKAQEAKTLLAEKIKNSRIELADLSAMRILFNEKKFDELINFVKEAESAGKAKEAHYGFAGSAYFKLGKLVEAETYFRKASQLSSDSRIKFALGTTNLVLGNISTAIRLLGDVNDEFSSVEEKKQLYESLLIAHYRAGNDDKSAVYLRKLTELDSTHGEKLKNLLGVKDSSYSELSIAPIIGKRIPEDTWWLMQIGPSLIKQEYVFAANLSTTFTERVPGTSAGWYFRGLAKFLIGDKVDARQSFAEAMKREPKGLMSLGQMLANKNAKDLLLGTYKLADTIDGVAAAKFKQSFLGESVEATVQPSTEGSPFEMYVAGISRLDCAVTCAFQFGMNRKKLFQMYEQKSWADLATDVLRIGYKSNLAYFYLGRAAEELGHFPAALTYYRLGRELRSNCTEADASKCSGLVFPKELDDGIARISKASTLPTVD